MRRARGRAEVGAYHRHPGEGRDDEQEDRRLGGQNNFRRRVDSQPPDPSLSQERVTRAAHERRIAMRVMVIMKANQDSEAGVMPGERLMTEMGAFNEELVKAGVMLAGEGLH